MTSVILSLCSSCKRKTGNTTCLSFMDGIPEDILFGLADHRQPIGTEPPYDPDPARIDLFGMWLRGYEDSLTASADDEFYRRDQPRDTRGRWMDAPGGMVPNVMPGGGLAPLPGDIAAEEARLLAGKQATCDGDDVDPLLRDLANRPSTNLARLKVRGEPNMYTHHVREIPRSEMPQLPENVEGLEAFRKALDGTKAEIKVIDPRTLHMTQNQLDSAKVGLIYNAIKEGGWRKDSLLFVSKDGDILDGHHRWAAAAAARLTGSKIDITVLQVDLPIDELLEVANTVSLARKSMAEGFAMRGRHSFDEDQPTSPPPNSYEPWFWWGGKWWHVVTDGGDEVAQELTFPEEEESLQASADDYRYNPNQKRDRLGRWTAGHGMPLMASGRYADLSEKGKKAYRDKMDEYGLTEQALDDQVRAHLTPETLEAGKRWYPDANRLCQRMAKDNDVSMEQMTAVMSAVSPRMPWPRNPVVAGDVVSKFRQYEGLSDRDAAKRIGGALEDNLTLGVQMARGGNIAENLTGAKRRSFYNNILLPGQTDDVTIDRWMMEIPIRAVKTGTQTDIMDKGEVESWLKASAVATEGGAGYLAISESIRRVAADMNLSPDVVQAAYWLDVGGKSEKE